MFREWRSGPWRWSVRDRALLALALIVFFTAALFAARALASGSAGDVLRIRFGGDAQRTRVVVDLDSAARGTVVDSGAGGRVIVSLTGVSPGRGLSGDGTGLVRGYRVAASGGNSRVEMNLASGAEIERRFLLPPGDGVAHYRYVIDLKATGRAAPAATAPAPRREAPRAEKPLIVIDAGHGGRDPGARGANNNEKDLTLAAARDLKAELERTGRYRVRLTRDSDVYVIHGRRVQIARDAGADLFISLHADAGSDPALRGASVYTLSEQGAGRAVREFTRNGDWQRDLRLPGRDPSVDRILLDMTQRATQNRSAQFARVLLTHLEAAERPLLRRSHRDAGLAVLLAPDVPAVLLEMGFITNPEDERTLGDDRQRRRMMRTVAQGIDRYFREPGAPMVMAGGGSNDG
ncbi:MAG: N-acetylmuramoyl-L-alanine amidase [Brevundimonas sp.]|uniref:N-acetylmuramoyl-L-alanine amidase family protein n=1 Tax=Brevundimonas sp. TaxID=1871086 RepID=UPI0011FD7A33|nr:N-acetylmuramoyl-L-alanine amidase [Brevundimonas sp.]RZJ16364.1 MAG: N-acetylmuramoyl-L-alanine amidase [Brevundimonas sp.]